jgi:periplasmic divalent cation tolerance protein
MSYILVNCTTSNKKDALEISKYLIEKKLAACINIIPNIISVYRWDGYVTEEEEFLLAIKTQKKLYKKLQAAILEKHEYELPEIIAIPVQEGYDKYLKWVKDETK